MADPRYHDAAMMSLATAALAGMLADYCWPGTLWWVTVPTMLLVATLCACAFAAEDVNGSANR